MNYKTSVDSLFENLGENVNVSIEGNSTETKALIQPMRYKNKLYVESQRTELGFKDSACFLYLGPAELDFAGREADTFIETEKGIYNVSRADRISLKGITQYIWAILTLRVKGGD